MEYSMDELVLSDTYHSLSLAKEAQANYDVLDHSNFDNMQALWLDYSYKVYDFK